jgi:molybdopterin molybdotransferase
VITFDKALAEILDRIQPMPTDSKELPQLAGHVTAQPVVARIDSPPFDNSAVDGFGVRLADVARASDDAPVRLDLKGVIRAGDAADLKLAAGSVLKILTGAAVPNSVDAVVMKEYCREENGFVHVLQSASAGDNIRRRGAEFLRGKEVLPAGRLVTPPVLGLIASLGYGSFDVYRKPKVAVVTTGNELTKPGRQLMPGKIFDSNSYAMAAAVHACGIDDLFSLHAAEDERSTKAQFKRALSLADVVISTGGVSVGDYDYVKAALESLHVETHIWRIAIKPGKPVYFGVLDDKSHKRRKYVFGLPGNPVSALVTFQLFVVPALTKLAGLADCPSTLEMTATLTSPLKKKAGRAEFVRGHLHSASGNLLVEPTTGQDSHMLSGLATANALILFPLDSENLSEGEKVTVRLLTWQQLVQSPSSSIY